MGKVFSKKEMQEVIQVLSERYPNTFTLIPYKTVPLVENIVGELYFDLGKVPSKYKSQIFNSVHWYMAWSTYLQAVAFGEHRRNLAGQRIERPTIAEREAARAKLKERGRWTKRMEMVFKVNMGRKEAANR